MFKARFHCIEIFLAVLALLVLMPAARAAEEGYVLKSSVWTDKSIPVCWFNPSPADKTEREWVRAAIERTWMRHSQVDFSGWGECSTYNPPNAIRIAIADLNPAVATLGNGIAVASPGMILNFSFVDWSPNCTYSDILRRACIEWTAVHEFGHALGFAHEQNRPDTPDACKRAPQGGDGDILIGAWDPESVMNYCNPAFNNLGALSRTDIKTVQSFYRAPLRDKNFSFDAQFYLSMYPELAAKFGRDYQAALDHWNTTGIREGRRGSREFDVVYYVNKYPDVYQAYRNDYAGALNHWISIGIDEGRRGSREVDVIYYLNKYGDVSAAYGNDYRAALGHWSNWGFKKQLQASADFSVWSYFNRYEDLRNAFRYTNTGSSYANDEVLGFLHWIRHGIYEGRNGQ